MTDTDDTNKEEFEQIIELSEDASSDEAIERWGRFLARLIRKNLLKKNEEKAPPEKGEL